MGIIYGPYDQADWFTMGMLRTSIKHSNSRNQDGRYNTNIKRDQDVLSTFFQKSSDTAEEEGVAA